MNKYAFGTKTKILAGMGAVIVFLGLLNGLWHVVSAWYDTHTIKFNQVVIVSFNKPFEVIERKPEIKEVVRVIESVDINKLTDIEKYICEKWGVYECQVAVAVARTESGLKEQAFNTFNKNGTLDVGVFQVNSVHFNQPGCSLKELVYAKKNVDCAYEIYKKSGWGAWSAYNSGAFKGALK